MEAFFLHLAQIGCAKEIVVFLSSMFPIWELKGAIILGQAWGLSPWVSYALSLAGSSLSAVILLLFLRPVICWMYKTRALRRFAEWLERRGEKKSDSVTKYETFGLFLFVAVPLPTTGVWTGSLIAAVLEMPLKRSIPAVLIGNVFAGLAIMLIYGVLTL